MWERASHWKSISKEEHEKTGDWNRIINDEIFSKKIERKRAPNGIALEWKGF